MRRSGQFCSKLSRRKLLAIMAGSSTGALSGGRLAILPAFAQDDSGRAALAMHGQPGLPVDFSHLPFVNPTAPKGGRFVFALQGTFDSLNPFVVRGVAPDAWQKYAAQSLLWRSPDEPFSAYGMLADRVWIDAARANITFRIDERARFSDGKPVTAQDIQFSLEMLKTKGKPFHRNALGRVTATKLHDARTIQFTLGEGGDRELPLLIGLMPLFAQHATDPEKFAETTFTPMLGSGPYLINEVKPGESVAMIRRKDFWAEDHPLVRGQYNFAEIRYDFYRDSNALFEAFKAGLCDLRFESDPTRWATGYDIPAVREGRITRETVKLKSPKGMSGLVFNTRRALFADARVREALGLVFDFPWTNSNLFFGLYRRADSFFADSELSAQGKPTNAEERAFLAAYPGTVREDILEGRYSPPLTDGSGRDRLRAREALDLMKAAGYEIRNGALHNVTSGEPFSFEITVSSRQQERLALNYAKAVGRIGVTANVRLIDDVQYWRRLATFDFDMVQWTWPASPSPGNEQINRWGSVAAERQGALNYAGVRSPAVDAVLKAMLGATDRESFTAYVRTLDRLLMSGFYVVPLFYVPELWLARASGVQRPQAQAAFGFVPEALWRSVDQPDSITEAPRKS
jgi:peptide/nickel transport system substrate-binding protein